MATYAYAGIDVGAAATKCTIITDEGKETAWAATRTGAARSR